MTKKEREIEQQIKERRLSEPKNLDDTLSDLDKLAKNHLTS